MNDWFLSLTFHAKTDRWNINLIFPLLYLWDNLFFLFGGGRHDVELLVHLLHLLLHRHHLHSLLSNFLERWFLLSMLLGYKKSVYIHTYLEIVMVPIFSSREYTSGLSAIINSWVWSQDKGKVDADLSAALYKVALTPIFA